MAGGIEYASKDAKPCHRFGNRRLDAIFVCDIAGDPDGARQILRGGPCLAAVKIDDGNAASFRREAARRGKAKTRCRTRCEQRLSREPHQCVASPSSAASAARKSVE